MTKICLNCNKEYDDSSKFCISCGISLITKETKSMDTDSNTPIKTNIKSTESLNIVNTQNVNFLYFFNVKLTTNQSNMDYLNDFTTLKTYINPNSFNGPINDTEFYVYPDYILLNNNMFTQKILYNMINDITVYNQMGSIFGNVLHIVLKSGTNLALNLGNIEKNQLSSLVNDIEHLINNPPHIADNNVKKVFNAKIIEKLDTIYKLTEITQFKQDISYLNQSSFEEDGLFVIYDHMIKVENKYFIQEFPYRIMKSFRLVDELYELELNNNIVIKFKFENPLNEYYVNLINENINRPPVVLNNNIPTNAQVTPQNQGPAFQNNQFNQQIQYNQPPVNQKSGAIAFILNLLLLGAGYAYVDKWGRFLLTFFILWPIFVGIGLFTFFIPSILFWFYVVINTNTLVNKYNRGELY